MSIAAIKAMYFNDDALMIDPFPLYRYEYRGDRFYYYQTPDVMDYDAQDKPPVKFAVGVTTLTRKTIPQNEGLVKWIAGMGYDNAIAYRDQRAKYGSLMHTCFATLLIKKVFNLDLLPEVVHNYCLAKSITVNETEWSEDLKQDLLAFATFMQEYHVKVKAIELSLVSPDLGLAGTLDLFCEMDYEVKGFFGETYQSGERKGQPKESKQIFRKLAIVDFKSGRDTTGGVHNAAQLTALREILQDNYDSYRDAVILLYNFHPKDWRKNPTYTLVDQTDQFSKVALHSIITLYRELEPDPEERTMLEMYGVIDLDRQDEQNYSTKVIKDIVQEAVNQKTYTKTDYDYADFYFNPVEDENGRSNS